jgi:hypothetical protein
VVLRLIGDVARVVGLRGAVVLVVLVAEVLTVSVGPGNGAAAKCATDKPTAATTAAAARSRERLGMGSS